MYICSCLRHSCGLAHIFTCDFIIFTVNWAFNQFLYELPKYSALQVLGKYVIPNYLHRIFFYLRVTLSHPVRHKEIPSLYVFGLFGAGGFTIFLRGWNSCCFEFVLHNLITHGPLWSILTIIFRPWCLPHQSACPLLVSSHLYFVWWKNWTPLL